MTSIRFDYGVPLGRTMVFEGVYHENLRLELSAKIEIWDTRGSIFVWMFVGGELAGEAYGVPLTESDEILRD
jgi:hypothetical protein